MAGTVVVSCRDLQGRKMADVLGALEEAFFSARFVCVTQELRFVFVRSCIYYPTWRALRTRTCVCLSCVRSCWAVCGRVSSL